MHEEPCSECEKFLTEGFEFIKNRAWGKAKACYEKALAVHSNNEKAWINLGRCYDRLGNAAKAFECYEEALHCNFLRTHELVNKGSMLMMGKKFKEALQCFDAAIHVDPRMQIALDNRQKVLQAMILQGLLRKIPISAVKWVSKGGRYGIEAGGELLKTLRGNVLELPTKALAERIVGDFEGCDDLLIGEGIVLEPKFFSAYVLASSRIDFLNDGDDLFMALPNWLRSDPVFEPAVGYPVTSMYQEVQQERVKLFLEEKGFPLNAWDRYTGEEWRKIVSFFQDIVADFTVYQKTVLYNLGSLYGGQYVMTILYLLGKCNEGDWARAIFSRTNDVCKIIGDEPVGPDALTDEDRDRKIAFIINGYEEKCLIAELYLKASEKKD